MESVNIVEDTNSTEDDDESNQGKDVKISIKSVSAEGLVVLGLS